MFRCCSRSSCVLNFDVDVSIGGGLVGKVVHGDKLFGECENIHSWISLSDDLVFSHQQGIYGFEFLKRFLEISSRDLTLLSILII